MYHHQCKTMEVMYHHQCKTMEVMYHHQCKTMEVMYHHQCKTMEVMYHHQCKTMEVMYHHQCKTMEVMYHHQCKTMEVMYHHQCKTMEVMYHHQCKTMEVMYHHQCKTMEVMYHHQCKTMEVMYHHQCKREYLNKSRDYKQARKDALSEDKKAKGAATKDLVHFVHSSVSGQNKPIQVSNLLDRYKKVYANEGGCAEKMNSYNVQHSAEKLRKLFSDSLMSVKADSMKKMIAWKGEGMSFQLASEEAKSHSSQSDSLIWDCAMRLRNEILHLTSEPLE